MSTVRSNLPVCTVEDYRLMPETGPRYQLVEVFSLAQSVEKPARVWGADATLETALLPGLKISAAKVFAR